MVYKLFTQNLYRFLLKEGYTNIYYRGIQDIRLKSTSPGQDPYILVPAKEDITLRFEETEMMVENIHSLDVQEMLEYTLGIDFWVELPDEVALRFGI